MIKKRLVLCINYYEKIRILKSKDRQLNGQTKNDKRTKNDLQNIAQATEDRVMQMFC